VVVVRLIVLASAVLVGCMSLVLGMAATLYAHTRQTSPCFAGNPDISSSAPSPPSTSGVLFINEVLPVPHSHWNCANQTKQTFDSDAWIELYDASSQTFDLSSNASIGIIDAEGRFFPFPPGAGIASHGFFVFFPQAAFPPISLTAELHLTVNSTVVDSFDPSSLPTPPPDQSYARAPDGSPNWQIAPTPTIGSSNVVATQTASTPTPTAKSTSKKASSSKKTGSTRSSSGRNSAGADQNSSNDPSQTGQDARQPSWKAMQLPGTSTQAVVSASRQHSRSPFPGAILLAASSLGLILALAWCWKLFIPKLKRKSG
jgi:hypothetical protein